MLRPSLQADGSAPAQSVRWEAAIAWGDESSEDDGESLAATGSAAAAVGTNEAVLRGDWARNIQWGDDAEEEGGEEDDGSDDDNVGAVTTQTRSLVLAAPRKVPAPSDAETPGYVEPRAASAAADAARAQCGPGVLPWALARSPRPLLPSFLCARRTSGGSLPRVVHSIPAQRHRE